MGSPHRKEKEHRVNFHESTCQRYPSNETTEINRLERIFHLFGKKPENPIDTKDGFLDPSLRHINN
jgi:hypothetical protein